MWYEFGLWIPIKEALKWSPTWIISGITVTLKDTETPNLKFLDTVYQNFLIAQIGWVLGLVLHIYVINNHSDMNKCYA